MAATASATQRGAMHRPAVADDRGVAAALASIVFQLHRQAGERIVGWRGDDRCNITDAKSETVSDLGLPRGLVFLSVLVIYAHASSTSALPPKADIGTHSRDVCFVPKADRCNEARL